MANIKPCIARANGIVGEDYYYIILLLSYHTFVLVYTCSRTQTRRPPLLGDYIIDFTIKVWEESIM